MRLTILDGKETSLAQLEGKISEVIGNYYTSNRNYSYQYTGKGKRGYEESLKANRKLD